MSCEYAKGKDPLKCEITARPCLVISDQDRTAYRHCLAREWKHGLETKPAPSRHRAGTEPAPSRHRAGTGWTCSEATMPKRHPNRAGGILPARPMPAIAL
jgi:hypothetical protein